jgi:hypothetical protein
VVTIKATEGADTGNKCIQPAANTPAYNMYTTAPAPAAQPPMVPGNTSVLLPPLALSAGCSVGAAPPGLLGAVMPALLTVPVTGSPGPDAVMGQLQ